MKTERAPPRGMPTEKDLRATAQEHKFPQIRSHPPAPIQPLGSKTAATIAQDSPKWLPLDPGGTIILVWHGSYPKLPLKFPPPPKNVVEPKTKTPRSTNNAQKQMQRPIQNHEIRRVSWITPAIIANLCVTHGLSLDRHTSSKDAPCLST